MMQQTISKLDAVRAQLDAAIEIYFTHDNLIAVHTLTAAAYNILRDIALKNGTKHPFIKRTFVDEYPEQKRKIIKDFINYPENFLKHADRDLDISITLDPQLTEILLMDALAYFRDKNESKPLYYEVFKAWCGIPSEDLDERTKVLTETFMMISRSGGKQEFWNLMKKSNQPNRSG
ncbi:MAG: hypothetical protein Q7T85_07290 [Nitrosomonas sp.]|nr:hypothetical protein [Nitrosomonas sp.]